MYCDYKLLNALGCISAKRLFLCNCEEYVYNSTTEISRAAHLRDIMRGKRDHLYFGVLF